jgi:hypothetical protein
MGLAASRLLPGGAPVTTMYASVADLRLVLDGTDSGTGTASQLTDAQLTLALRSASSRISVFAGNVYDGSTPQAVAPDIFHDLALDLAAFWATGTYLKNKAISPTHPVFIKYANAQEILTAVRDGRLRLDPAVAPGIGAETGIVINRIPPIFTGDDSNTELNPMTGTMQSGTPFGMWTPNSGNDWQGAGGPIYQG